jgi:hypothetical protein
MSNWIEWTLMVRRIDIEAFDPDMGPPDTREVESPSGRYVRFEDYEILERALAALPKFKVCYHHNYRSTGHGLVCADCGYTWQNKRR